LIAGLGCPRVVPVKSGLIQPPPRPFANFATGPVKEPCGSDALLRYSVRGRVEVDRAEHLPGQFNILVRRMPLVTAGEVRAVDDGLADGRLRGLEAVGNYFVEQSGYDAGLGQLRITDLAGLVDLLARQAELFDCGGKTVLVWNGFRTPIGSNLASCLGGVVFVGQPAHGPMQDFIGVPLCGAGGGYQRVDGIPRTASGLTLCYVIGERSQIARVEKLR
jgi:hypothetical protein